MPRKKIQGIQLQRKTPVKPSSIQFKKTVIDAKSNDADEEDLRVPMLLTEPVESSDFSNTNYLHKKFKKVAGVATTPKTDNLTNGISAHLEYHKSTNGIVSFLDESRLSNGDCRVELVRSPNKITEAASEEDIPSSQPGRYVCPYCQMICAKPSVLQKHIRAHTNERPYPCAPCGFSFKTKSNLYKHCRSQAHRVKTELGERCDNVEYDSSEESSQSSPDHDGVRSDDHPPRIYKPKFHKAVFYQEEPLAGTCLKPKISPSSEQLEERISKIIRDNQVIFDTMEPQFSKKFLQRQNSREKESTSPKSDTEARRNNETKSKLALALLKVDRNDRSYSPSYPHVNSELQTYQPLNLTKKSPGASNTEGVLPHSSEVSTEPDNEIGPLLGNTPLVDGPSAQKRRVQSTTVPPDPRGLVNFSSRRLSTSSLPSTLKSLEELSKHPIKHPVQMFGGEVKILDGGETRTVRFSSSGGVSSTNESTRVVTVAKSGLLASGGTLVGPSPSAFHIANILSTDTSSFTLAPNVVTPNLAIPGVPQPEPGVGVLTIMHGEKAIPFVPGMPGPQSLLSDSPRRPKPSSSSVSSVQKPSSSSVKQNVPNDVPKIEISAPPEENKPSQRFLRPSSLPLKPGSFTPKRLHQGTTPTVLSLVSPETPRPNKSYGQLFLNGHAYTYLGLKCSTRSYYCTISRPQPMYVVQSPLLPRLSMYSNWKVYSESDPLGLTPGQAMAQYDSRYKTGGFTTADSGKNRSDITMVSHSSLWKVRKKESSDETSGEPGRKRFKVCNGGYESLEDYTYVRGRGRGRYVCEECGIRCKKPSMLKKHIRSHSDLRPYSCKHCAFAFKTKGNLTKHMKSKTHYKRCSELGVDPTPPVLSDGDSDRPEESGSSDAESEYSDDDDSSAGTAALEREAACSLLTLSSSPLVLKHVAAGLLPRAGHDPGPACYPYSNVLLKNAQVQTEVNPPYREESPMDLSQKEPHEFLSKDSQFLKVQSHDTEVKRPSETVRIVPAYLAATIAPVQEPENMVVEPPGGHMLQAYLTAKALRDVQIKQKLRSRSPDLPLEAVSIMGSSTDQITVTHVNSTPVTNSNAPNTIANQSNEHSEQTSRILVVGDPNDAAKRVIVNIPVCGNQPEPAVSAEQRVSNALNKTQDTNLKAEFFPPASGPNHSYVSVTEDGRSICVICNKTFSKPSQLRLHVNIHYFERPFRCEACAVSFRTKGHLQKHERSVSHHNKVSMNTTFGAATTTNPRPFKCDDCKIAFRIHGHLAKHLRSKMHIMKLECLGKLPFGTYAELERSGFNLNEIDTSDCDNSLESLQALAQKLYEKDSSKFGQPPERRLIDEGGADSDSSSEGLQTEQCQCTICGDTHDSSAALQVHLLAEHSKEAVLDKRKSED